MKKTIIGLVGDIASGKGMVAKILEDKGYSRHVLSDRIREEISRHGLIDLVDDRETLQDIGNELRCEHGPQALAEITDSFINASQSRFVVVDGLRNTAEIAYFKAKYPEFYVIGVDADKEVRLGRYLARTKRGDPKTEVDFNRLDSRDMGTGENKFGQQVSVCFEIADIVITNNWDKIDPLRKEVEGALVTLGIEGQIKQRERK